MNQKVINLIVCVCGIYVFHLGLALFQEKLYTDGFQFPLFTVAAECLSAAIGSGLFYLIAFQKLPFSGLKVPTFWQVAQGILYSLAMLFTNYSLKYVSYPTKTLAKSCKVLPVMFMGIIFKQEVYDRFEYMAVTLITTGLVLFNFSTSGNKGTDHLFGIFMLLCSLICDGLVGVVVQYNKRQFSPSAIQMMFYSNLWSFFILEAVSYATGDFQSAISRLDGHENALLGLCLCGFTGQLFIYRCLKIFNPFITTIITTTRKFVTIILSVIVYNHFLTPLQWSCVFLVFAGVASDVYSNKKSKKE